MSEYPLDWTISNLGAHLTETKERAGGSNTIPYSVSKVLGIVPQSEKFNKRVASSDISNYKVIRKGDFAYDPMLLWDGSINRMLREGKGAVSPAYVTFRVTSNSLDADYLLHLLKANTTKNFYKSISKGTNVRRQKAEFCDFAGGEFAFPPLPEQKKIAEILSGIDRTIAAAFKEKQHRERLRRSAIKQLTRGALFRGQKKDSGTEFGMIPAHWECLLIPECCTIENSKRKPIKKEERSKMRGIYPYHGATRIQDYISEYAYEGDYVLIGEDGDHFSKYDEWEMAQFATGRFNVSNHAHVIKGAHNCSTKWLHYSLLHRDLTYHLTRQGATRFKLSKASLECIPVILPPPEEQVKMTSTFDSISRSISILNDRIIKLQALKVSLSSDLLSGRKRVSI